MIEITDEMAMEDHAPDTSTEALDDLADDLDKGGNCIFCGRDPYHYVDIGVGYERVAVVCCEPGIALYRDGDKQFVELSGRLHHAAHTLRYLAAQSRVPASSNMRPATTGDTK